MASGGGARRGRDRGEDARKRGRGERGREEEDERLRRGHGGGTVRWETGFGTAGRRYLVGRRPAPAAWNFQGEQGFSCSGQAREELGWSGLPTRAEQAFDDFNKVGTSLKRAHLV